MWQLELLSKVVPAFGALTRVYLENEHQDGRLRNAEDCYADIVTIGHAVCRSGGEWASGLDDTDVTKLLTAFETRFPTRAKSFPVSLAAWRLRETTEVEYSGRAQFPHLIALAGSLTSAGLGGYHECYEIMNQTKEDREGYLAVLGEDVWLFHKGEKRDPNKREKFLKRVRRAATHLLEVYYKGDSGHDGESFALSQHPSHGMKEVADKVYHIIERHWRCNCPQRTARLPSSREARLNLNRHGKSAPNTTARIDIGRLQFPVKFELLLPVCKDTVEWKVTNVEVTNAASRTAATITRKAISHDLCQYIRKSDDMMQVDVLIENDSLWHLKPKLHEGISHHTSMEPLHQLLGDGLEISYISRCNPREQLILCYILANSMLYLYPGYWFQTEWNSSMVYFVRRSRTSTSPALTYPYLNVELKEINATRSPPDHMQIHTHPFILALGIIFLEIVTGIRFKRTREVTPWEQCNKDNSQAWKLLINLEKADRRHRLRRISPGLSQAIHACLKLEPPPSFPSNRLSEEGPIRHYILSCIVRPLAYELQEGYKVSLEDLHTSLISEKEGSNLDSPDDLKSLSRRSTASIKEDNQLNNTNASHFTSNTQLRFKSSIATTFTEYREACSYRNREELVDEKKVKAAATWFEWHNDAFLRIAAIRNSARSDARQVKIAILDSGIEISQDSQDMYNFEPRMKYRSWIDQETTWKDETGHGTHLAILLRKVAPNAIIHVGRVFKKEPTRKSANIIAEAVRYAVDDWKVDIIVMSFGFGEEYDQLDSAIQHAVYKKVLMFAAASNDGKNRPDGVAWPAKDNNVICVHSGDGHGSHSTFTPSPRDSMRIMVLGECVKSACPPHLRCDADQKLMSGTSCAAPIAAGIAALILDYARGFLDDQEWDKLCRTTSMLRMFERMKDEHSTDGYWWIKHWQWFDSNKSVGWIQGEIRGVI